MRKLQQCRGAGLKETGPKLRLNRIGKTGSDSAVPSAKNALDLPFLFFEGETMSPISALKTSGMTIYEQPIFRGMAIPPGIAGPVADGGHQSVDTIF